MKQKGIADKVNIDAAFSVRPEADGTIAVSVSDSVIPRSDSVDATFRDVKQAIETAFAGK